MISGGKEVNEFSQVCLVIEANFGYDPLLLLF